MSVSSATSLTALPPELLSLVVTKIASKSTLCHLARCSRQLYLCTIPHLYGHITIQEDGEQKDDRLMMLTTLLLRRPDLAMLVRLFSLHVPRPSRGNEKVQAFANAVHPSGISHQELFNCLEVYDCAHGTRHDLILSFLLPSLLKVEKLVLDVYNNSKSHFLKEAIRKAVARERPLDTQRPFEALTVFVYSKHWNSLWAREADFIASLLKLPAIQEISGDLADWNTPNGHHDDGTGKGTSADRNLSELESSSSPLTSLDLATFFVLAVDMRHILRVPISLKHLSITISSFCKIGCANIPWALEPQKNSLESIAIYCDESIEEMIVDGYVFTPMASFTRFSALKVFKAAGIFLTATVHGSGRHNLLNMFPPSLETLHLTRFQSDFNNPLEALEHLLTCKSPRQIPSLTTLILEETVSNGTPPTRLMDVLWGNTQELATEKLSGVGKAQNVSFEVIEESREDGKDWCYGVQALRG
ncbi:hypothetical protein MMC22_010358 [Lobaria immixta]|nr:hypothetical protein [Lobaria immixta]